VSTQIGFFLFHHGRFRRFFRRLRTYAQFKNAAPLRPNNNGDGGSRHSSEETNETAPGTLEERLQAVERTQIERHTLEAVLEDQCKELNEYVLNHGCQSIVNQLKGGVKRRMEQLRVAHLEYNKALHNNHDPLDDPYIYIIGHEIRVRGCLTLVRVYLHSRRDSPASSVSRQSIPDSFYTANDHTRRSPVQPPPGRGQPNPTTQSMPFVSPPAAPPGNGQPNPTTQLMPYIPHTPATPTGYGQPNPAAPPMPYTPHPPGHGHPNHATPKITFTPHLPPPAGWRRSDDWILSRLRTPKAGTPGAAEFTPNWLMNALPQIKIEQKLVIQRNGPPLYRRFEIWCIT
jgi:hypothetical protein